MIHTLGHADVSVVVIGRNEGPRLRRCLESIVRAGGDRLHEWIYVDSDSTDDSRAIAAGYGAHVIALKGGAMSAARARNEGWRHASSPWVLFLDGDTELAPGFLDEALAAIERTDTAVVWGHRRESRPHASWFNRVLDLDWIYPAGESDFCGGDALVRRSALAMVDGFDAGLIAGEEPEMCARLRAAGWRIVHIDKPMTKHDLAMTGWRQYWRRAKRAGYAYAQVSDKCRAAGRSFWEDECRRNFVRAGAWMVVLIATMLLAAWQATPAWLIVPVSLLTILGARSAWRARWRSVDPLALLLYGMHSQLQQLPIAVGQLAFRRDRRRGRGRGLIEYKEAVRGTC